MAKKILLPMLIILFFSAFFIILKNKPKSAVVPEPQPQDIITKEKKDATAQTMPEKFYAPILIYHHIAPNPNNNQYYVSPEMFEQQMEWLKNNNYNVISYNDLYRALTGNFILPANPVVITFDDGNKDQYDNAFPILKKYNYPAMFYIQTISIGKSKWMSFDMMRDLLNSGMELGSHTVTHYNLPKQNHETIKRELVESKQIMEKNLGIEVNFFSYPNGVYSQAVIDELINAGYKSAATAQQTIWQDKKQSIYLVPRIYITDDLESFISKISAPKQ